MKPALILAALALATTPARGGVWSDATSGNSSASDFGYAKLLERADDAANMAVSAQAPRSKTTQLIDAAIALYEDAARAEPSAAEPYARIAKLIESFYFEECVDPLTAAQHHITNASPFCQPFPRERARQLVAAWNGLEKRAPFDPRFATCSEPGYGNGRCERFERAILSTKLGTHDDLVAAERDYRAIIAQADAGTELGIVANNLAETEMMLGELEESIETYRRALGYRTDVSTAFGLAVALDRDEETTEARSLVLEIGENGFEEFRASIGRGETFFVPAGEEYYYLALADEAFGQLARAEPEWQKYLDSGAHPQYQPRARAHLATLQAQLKLHPKFLPPTRPFDPYDE